MDESKLPPPTPSRSTKSEQRERRQKRWAHEWASMSANNTRSVYNFGIGSLMNWATVQYSQQRLHNNEFPSVFRPIERLHPMAVTGITRKFDYCWRYTAVAAVSCDYCLDGNHEGDDDCAPVVGACFELKEDDYPRIREREAAYSIIEVKPEQPLPGGFDPHGYYFAWGNPKDPVYDCTNTTGKARWEPMISQAYWDMIIGGILAWDGQLLNDSMYTWDFDTELAARENGNYDFFSNSVARMPSLSLEERRQMAIAFTKTTSNSPQICWVNDRACPYTGDSIITTNNMLKYPEEIFGEHQSSLPESALGTASPLASEIFYNYVDGILIEAAWNAKNSIEHRINQCENSGDQNLGIVDDHSSEAICAPNPYYNNILQWRNANARLVPGGLSDG